MPLPPAPPREWRPIVERCLAAFNGLLVVYWAFFRLTLAPGPHDAETTAMPPLLGSIALVAAIGSVVRMPRVLRGILIFPSAIVWTLLGLFSLASLVAGGDSYHPGDPSTLVAIGWGFVATAAGVLSFVLL